MPSDDLTRYLEALGRGESSDGPQALLFMELHAIAQAYLRNGSAGVTLQPTVLVNEAYLKLFQHTREGWNDRAHFFAVAAKAMRQILVDHARAQGRLKRSPAALRITLDEQIAGAQESDVDLVELDDLLAELASWDERAARLVELRFFAGLEMKDVAETLAISLTTAEREWRAARAWLGTRMEADHER
jgi:RNA polymerase sigma factor (TIGR02999 family)